MRMNAMFWGIVWLALQFVNTNSVQNLLQNFLHNFLQTWTSLPGRFLDVGDTVPLQHLIKTIAILTTQVSLLALALAGLTYMVGSALRGAPIPMREVREAGYGLQTDALRAIFWIAIYSTLASLVAWTAALLASS